MAWKYSQKIDPFRTDSNLIIVISRTTQLYCFFVVRIKREIKPGYSRHAGLCEFHTKVKDFLHINSIGIIVMLTIA